MDSTPFYWNFNKHVKSVQGRSVLFQFFPNPKKDKNDLHQSQKLALTLKNSKNTIKTHFSKTIENKNKNPLSLK